MLGSRRDSCRALQAVAVLPGAASADSKKEQRGHWRRQQQHQRCSKLSGGCRACSTAEACSQGNKDTGLAGHEDRQHSGVLLTRTEQQQQRYQRLCIHACSASSRCFIAALLVLLLHIVSTLGLLQALTMQRRYFPSLLTIFHDCCRKIAAAGLQGVGTSSWVFWQRCGSG